MGDIDSIISWVHFLFQGLISWWIILNNWQCIEIDPSLKGSRMWTIKCRIYYKTLTDTSSGWWSSARKQLNKKAFEVGCILPACQLYMFWWPPLGVSSRGWVSLGPYTERWVPSRSHVQGVGTTPRAGPMSGSVPGHIHPWNTHPLPLWDTHPLTYPAPPSPIVQNDRHLWKHYRTNHFDVWHLLRNQFLSQNFSFNADVWVIFANSLWI